MLGTEKLVVKLSQSIVPREDTSQHTRQMCRRYLHELSKVLCAKEGAGAVGCVGAKRKHVLGELRRGSPIRNKDREGREKAVSTKLSEGPRVWM